MAEYLVEFRGRNESGRFTQNFLWKDNNVYIMDNHRAALWCWLQHVDIQQEYSILHIDRHYDNGNSVITPNKKNLPNINKMTINEYLEMDYEPETRPERRMYIFGFDNYLTVFLENYYKIIGEKRFITQKDGNLQEGNEDIYQPEIHELLGNLDFWLSRYTNWIVNLDLDIMFCAAGKLNEDESDYLNIQFLSDKFISELGKILKNNIDNGRIKVLTIALSPEYCCGWGESERILKLLLAQLQIEFELPE